MAKQSNSSDVSGWTGWVSFASIMLVVLGSFHIAGLVALFKDEILVFGQNNIWLVDYTTWGWVHLLWGALAIWVEASLANGNLYGRIFAVVVAVISGVNLAFVPVYPIWSILIIAIDVCVIYAVTVHGKEIRELE